MEVLSLLTDSGEDGLSAQDRDEDLFREGVAALAEAMAVESLEGSYEVTDSEILLTKPANGRSIGAASLGAALAIVAASVLFSWFIGMSSRYALVYGSLASLIILLAWLYLCGNILLLGAVAGRVLEDRLRSR